MLNNLSKHFIVMVILITTIIIPKILAEDDVEKQKELKVGMIAPDFKLKDDKNKERSLGEFLGKKNVVLAFYPKDMTGG